MTSPRELPMPAFYAAENAARYGYRPNHTLLLEEATAFRERHGVAPSGEDRRNVHLLLIDVQKDFCFPEGSLFVGGRSGRGAIDDSARITSFLYRNLASITNVTVTLDSHLAFQIFFASFWVDRAGAPLAPFREISTSDIDRGDVRPNPAIAPWLFDGDYDALAKHARHYAAELERAGRYRLYLWPPHCVLGSDGHALVGVVDEARIFHSYVRGVQSWVEVKGTHPLTENYSVLRPEVMSRHDGRPIAERNTAFLDKLLAADAVIVAGQAASHCIKSSVEDLLDEIQVKDPSFARRVYLLSDCMSAVTVPDGEGGFVADFTPETEEALARFERAGVHVVRSVDPMASWPGFPEP